LFKKYKLLFSYIKTIKKHLPDIRNHFISNNLRNTFIIKDMNIDSIYRIYTVLNFPEQTINNIQKYGYYYMDNETKKFISQLNTELKKYGLDELVGLSKADQIGENNILIVVQFKLLKIEKIYRRLIYFLIAIIIGACLFFI